MSLNLKALPWRPVENSGHILSFKARAWLCTHCVVALHQGSSAVETEVNGLVGVTGRSGWYMTARAVPGTEAEQDCCDMCGKALTLHSVPEHVRHGHKVLFLQPCEDVILHNGLVRRKGSLSTED